MAHTIGTQAATLDSFLSTHLAGLDTVIGTAALADYAGSVGVWIGGGWLLARARWIEPTKVEGCRQRMQRALTGGWFVAAELFTRLSRG